MCNVQLEARYTLLYHAQETVTNIVRPYLLRFLEAMSDDNSSLTYVFLHNWLDRSYSNQDLFKNPKMDPKPNQESGSGSSPE